MTGLMSLMRSPSLPVDRRGGCECADPPDLVLTPAYPAAGPCSTRTSIDDLLARVYEPSRARPGISYKDDL